MKTKIVWFILLMALMVNGCGGGGGSTSSFNEGDNNPVINDITTSNEQNISSIVKEENGEYKVYVNENQRTAFKINAKDNSRVTYSLSGGDWRLFDVDKYGGEFYFKDFADFESKKTYKTTLIVDDGLGHTTEKKVTIYLNDIKNEIAPIKVINSNESLSTDDELKYFITTWKVESDSKDITIPTIGDGYNYSVDWGDGTSSKNVTENITHTYNQKGTYVVKISGSFPRIYFGYYYDNEGFNSNFKLISINQWGTNQWSSMYMAFAKCINLTINTSDTPNLSKVTNMNGMFLGAVNMNQDIGNWDVSHVTNMSNMFSNDEFLLYGIPYSITTNICQDINNDGQCDSEDTKKTDKRLFKLTDDEAVHMSFNQDISNWDVSNVTDMSAMFNDATNFNQDISNWDVSSVTDMRGMFRQATFFNQDISNWDVSNVTDISGMFIMATKFNQDIENWNTSNVTYMVETFKDSNSFNQNIGNWDVSSVTAMNGMFNRATSFNQDIGGWNVSNVTYMAEMFKNSTSFNQDIESWNVFNITTNMGLMFDGATALEKIPSWYQE